MSVRRALLFSYVEKYGTYVLGIVAAIVISRLLSPADVGAFSIGMTLVGIAAVFREFGVSTYLVQEVELTDGRIAAAFTLTVGTGVVLGLLVAALAEPAAAFYGDPRLRSILYILALSFALTPLGSVSQSLLSRELRFGSLAWIRLAYAAVNASVGILLAWLGFGPVSLAWAALCGVVVNSAASVACRPHTLSLRFGREDMKRVMDVGLPTTAVSIVDDLINTIPDLVVGRWQGLAAAGLLSRARGLSQMASQLIARAAGPVFFAVYAEQKRDGKDVGELYMRATSCVCGAGWTLLASIAVLASPLVQLLFGSQWTEVSRLLPWLCASASVLLLTSGAHILLLALGGASDALRAKAWALPWYLGCGISGALVSLQAMVVATLLASVAAAALLALAVRARVGIGLRTQLKPLLTSSLPALAAGLASMPAAIWYVGSDVSSWVAVLVGGACAGIGAATALASSNSPLRQEVLRLWRARTAVA